MNLSKFFLIGHLSTRVSLAFAVMLALLPVQVSPALAQGAGDLIVAPTRIVLEGRTRSAQLSLVNKGSATATYRISIINMQMDDQGTVHEIKEPAPDLKTAEKLIRYSPRQITLKPGGTQAVRVLLRKPKDLKEGEYRSHILFRAIPKDAGQSVEQSATTDGIQIKLTPIYGITIPVIVRHGKLQFAASLNDLEIQAAAKKNDLAILKFNITRTGDKSTFGDLVATYKPSSGAEVVVGNIMRLAVYSPNKMRSVEMKLRVPDGVKLIGGTLKLAYMADADNGGKLLAENQISLP